LLATVGYLEAKATDDALELFEVIMTSELLARAERQSSADKLKRYPRLCKDARRLAAAGSVLLEAQEWDENITIGVLWDAIENVVSRAELRVSVASINQMLPPDADPDGEWRSALMSRYPLVRRFLRLLVETIEFGATTDAAPVLSALKGLPGLLDAGSTKRVPVGYLDARKVAMEVVTPGWHELVLRPGRPEGTVDRVAYVFCVLDQR
ncbi:MAG: Tn3 family transposase, partial [Actinomycetes bacterium]